MSTRKQQFTLIELLVTIVVISMLVGITVPVFNRLMTGNGVSYGARIVTSQLNMARVEACRSRRIVAVVFADASTTDATYLPAENAVLNKRAFRACYLAEDKVTFDGWVPGTQWEVLPTGVYFDFSSDSNFVGVTLSDNAFTERDEKVKVQKEDGTEEEVDNASYRPLDDESRPAFIIKSGNRPKHVIAFKRSGKPLEAKTLIVTVREGVITDNTISDSATTEIQKYDADNYLRIKVNRYTGNVRTVQR